MTTNQTAAFDPADAAPALGAALDRLAREGGRVALDPDTVEQDLARLVLGLMEFLRKLMEAQALRRMEAGSLTPEQEEALGATLMRSSEALRSLAGRFGLSERDLSLDLGPLGRLS